MRNIWKHNYWKRCLSQWYLLLFAKKDTIRSSMCQGQCSTMPVQGSITRISCVLHLDANKPNEGRSIVGHGQFCWIGQISVWHWSVAPPFWYHLFEMWIVQVRDDNQKNDIFLVQDDNSELVLLGRSTFVAGYWHDWCYPVSITVM